MLYFDIDDVRGCLPGGTSIDDQTGYPTKAIVEEEILGCEGRINVAFKQGGASLPITDPDVLADIKIYGKREVAYQVAVIRQAIADEKTVPEFRKWHDEFEAWRKEVALGKYAGLASSEDVPWSHTRDADTSDPSDDRNPVFVKDYVP